MSARPSSESARLRQRSTNETSQLRVLRAKRKFLNPPSSARSFGWHNRRKNIQAKLTSMSTQETFYGVSLHGLPVRIEMNWPFHPSEGGSDWYVVHGRVNLADGGELHADVALNLSQTVREALPSLESDLAFWGVGEHGAQGARRQTTATAEVGQAPAGFGFQSQLQYPAETFHLLDGDAEQIDDFVARKIFWGAGEPVLVADPCDAQYLGAADPGMTETLMGAAKSLAAQGLAELTGDSARATESLLAQADAFRAVKDRAVEELHMKHAFERA